MHDPTATVCIPFLHALQPAQSAPHNTIPTSTKPTRPSTFTFNCVKLLGHAYKHSCCCSLPPVSVCHSSLPPVSICLTPLSPVFVCHSPSPPVSVCHSSLSPVLIVTLICLLFLSVTLSCLRAGGSCLAGIAAPPAPGQ
jgi:hypothetical protein